MRANFVVDNGIPPLLTLLETSQINKLRGAPPLTRVVHQHSTICGRFDDREQRQHNHPPQEHTSQHNSTAILDNNYATDNNGGNTAGYYHRNDRGDNNDSVELRTCTAERNACFDKWSRQVASTGCSLHATTIIRPWMGHTSYTTTTTTVRHNHHHHVTATTITTSTRPATPTEQRQPQ